MMKRKTAIRLAGALLALSLSLMIPDRAVADPACCVTWSICCYRSGEVCDPCGTCTRQPWAKFYAGGCAPE